MSSASGWHGPLRLEEGTVEAPLQARLLHGSPAPEAGDVLGLRQRPGLVDVVGLQVLGVVDGTVWFVPTDDEEGLAEGLWVLGSTRDGLTLTGGAL